MSKVIQLVLISLLLVNCSFAPKYQRPLMPIPLAYKETKEWKQAKGFPTLNKKIAWWRMYGDPVLDRLEAKVYCDNQNLKLALARYQEARAALQVTASKLYPTAISISNTDKQKTSNNVANPNIETRFSDFLTGINIMYEVDLWGRVRNSVLASQGATNASAADLAGVELSMQTELAKNYFQLRGYEEALHVLEATVVAYEKALYITRKRYTGGVAPIADVDNAITQLENAKTLATDTRLNRAVLEHAIAVLIGESPANFTLTKSLKPMKLVSIAPQLPSCLLERRPDIVAAEERVKAANAEIGVAWAAFFPQINFSSLLGFESQHLSNLFSQPSLFWSLGPINGLSVVQPLANLVLYDGGRLQGLLKTAKASYFETVASYRQTVLTAFQEVEDSLVTIRRLDEENRTQSLATAAAKRALVQARDRYFGGISNYLDVIINENLALQAELALVKIRTRRQVASVELIKALGGGWSIRGISNYSLITA